jgi:hypothetical protein
MRDRRDLEYNATQMATAASEDARVGLRRTLAAAREVLHYPETVTPRGDVVVLRRSSEGDCHVVLACLASLGELPAPSERDALVTGTWPDDFLLAQLALQEDDLDRADELARRCIDAKKASESWHRGAWGVRALVAARRGRFDLADEALAAAERVPSECELPLLHLANVRRVVNGMRR